MESTTSGRRGATCASTASSSPRAATRRDDDSEARSVFARRRHGEMQTHDPDDSAHDLVPRGAMTQIPSFLSVWSDLGEFDGPEGPYPFRPHEDVPVRIRRDGRVVLRRWRTGRAPGRRARPRPVRAVRRGAEERVRPARTSQHGREGECASTGAERGPAVPQPHGLRTPAPPRPHMAATTAVPKARTSAMLGPFWDHVWRHAGVSVPDICWTKCNICLLVFGVVRCCFRRRHVCLYIFRYPCCHESFKSLAASDMRVQKQGAAPLSTRGGAGGPRSHSVVLCSSHESLMAGRERSARSKA